LLFDEFPTHESEFGALNVGLLKLDEGQRIALGIMRLPELMRRSATAADSVIEAFPVIVEVDRGADRREQVARL
jgi:hypothetical protein